MNNTHGMNVRETLLGFAENWDDSVLNQLSIVNDSEFALLTQLDAARKCLDIELSEGDGSYPSINAYTRRVLLHTLRKYSQPITLATKDSTSSSSIDGHITLTGVNGINGDEVYGVAELSRLDYTSLLEANAMRGFLNRNKSVQRHLPRHLVPLMRAFLRTALDGFEEEFVDAPGHFGPGAVSEGLTTFQRWHLLGRNPYWCHLTEDIGSWSPNQDAARLCAVPKEWNKQRLITVEPYETTYLQHKTRHALSRTLVRNGLKKLALQGDSRMDIPAIHRQLCCESSATSASGVSRIDTIDLSDASDCISWESVVSVFPWEVVVELERARSPSFLVDLNKVNWSVPRLGDRYVNLPLMGASPRTFDMHIYGGMGNSTTFLVEGLMFYALLQAVSEYYRIPNRKARDISVFGDDLIVPTGYYDLYSQSLCEAGFKINKSKSFYGRQPVRESCGMWAYMGENLYVPPYKGYDESASGQLGLAEYLRNAPWPIRDCFLGRVKDWPNTPKPIPNTVSVVDEDREISWERSRYSSKKSCREWFLKTAKTATRLHLCVRRGGAYMMISRVPSEEGLSKDVLLVEALAQPERHMAQYIGTVVEIRTPVHQSFACDKQEEATGELALNRLTATSKCVVTHALCEVARIVGEYNSHVRKPNMFRSLKFLCDLASYRVKPDTGEIKLLRKRYQDACKVTGYPIKVIRNLLRSRVKVLEETIPHSTTLRSSWVSLT